MFCKLTLVLAALSTCAALRGQTVTYRFDTAPEGIYLVERVERDVPGSARKQVIETPTFLRDTAGVTEYLSLMRQKRTEAEGKVREAIAERDFFRSKLQVLAGLSDSLFFKPKTVVKND